MPDPVNSKVWDIRRPQIHILGRSNYELLKCRKETPSRTKTRLSTYAWCGKTIANEIIRSGIVLLLLIACCASPSFALPSRIRKLLKESIVTEAPWQAEELGSMATQAVNKITGKNTSPYWK